MFEKNRKYANGTQDTNIYKKLLNNLDPNSGDGSLINIDYTPVPVLPKFVKILVNKVLSREPYPNLEAVDPFSSSKKQKQKELLQDQINSKAKLLDLKEKTGTVLNVDQKSCQILTRKLKSL